MESIAQIRSRLKKIRVKAEEPRTPFPYDDARRLRALWDASTYGDPDKFIPRLNGYGMDIAGLASWGANALRWSPAELDKAIKTLGRSFFDKHPEYSSIQALLTEMSLQALACYLDTKEEIRLELLAVLEELSPS